MIPDWSGVTWQKVVSSAIEASVGNKEILRCSGASVLLSVKRACEFGLSLSKVLGQAYLVPFKQQCELIIGYKGLMDLVRRAADVKVLDADAVYEGDGFEVTKGNKPELRHTFDLTKPREADKLTHAYSIAFYENGHPHFIVMTRSQIDAIRQRSKAGSRGPWVTDYAAMAIKTAIRRHANYLPLSAEKARLLEAAMEHDDRVSGLEMTHADPEDNLSKLKSRLDGEVDAPEEEPEGPPVDIAPDVEGPFGEDRN